MTIEAAIALWPQLAALVAAVGVVIAIIVKMTPTQRDDIIFAKVKKVWAVVVQAVNKLMGKP